MENEVLQAIKTRRSIRSFSENGVPDGLLEAVLEAGTYAPTGGGKQSPIIIAIKDPVYRKEIACLNAEVMGKDTDPYYGAPIVILVLADGKASTFVEDGSCVLENMMPRTLWDSVPYGYTANVKFLTAKKVRRFSANGGCPKHCAALGRLHSDTPTLQSNFLRLSRGNPIIS